MPRKIIVLTLLVAVILTGGCWDRRELNELAIVLGAGVDRLPDGRIQLTLQLARPSAFGGGEGGANVSMNQNIAWVVSGTGERSQTPSATWPCRFPAGSPGRTTLCWFSANRRPGAGCAI